MRLILLLLYWTVHLRDNGGVDASSSLEKKLLDKLLDQSSYDHRVRPPGLDMDPDLPQGGPVNVTINMMIRSISKIDEVNMEFNTQLTFREEWYDPRLAYGDPDKQSQIENAAASEEDAVSVLPDFLVLSTGQTIWMPDTFFQNEKHARRHDIDKPNVLIRIYKDGGILYSVRLSLVLSCPMNLQDYPMDVQQCQIQMGSYAYTDDDINYLWKPGTPIQIKGGVENSLPSFTLTGIEVGFCTSTTNTGTYSCLETTLTLRRQFSYFLMQVYLPTSMLVIVSWVSFWLDRTAVPARVSLGVTSLLTMTTQASGINAKLPPVSYTKAIDIWIGACLVFIFAALLEFAYVTYTGTRDSQRKSKKTPPGPKPPSTQPMIVSPPHSTIVNVGLLDTKGTTDETKTDKRGLLDVLGKKKRQPVSHMPPKYGYFYSKLDNPYSRPSVIGGGGSIRPTDGDASGDSGEDSAVWVPHMCCRQMEQVVAGVPVPAVLLPAQHQHRHTRRRQHHRWHCCGLLSWLRRKWQDAMRDMADDNSKKVDYFSRFCFPAAFLLFNAFYWFNFSSYEVRT